MQVLNAAGITPERMTIVLIYHPDERSRAEPFAKAFQALGFLPVLAPLGVQIGTEDWIRKVKADIEASPACFLFLSAKSVMDPWVAQRAEWAINAKGRLIPIRLDDSIPPFSQWVLPERVSFYNQFSCTSTVELTKTVQWIAAALPKPVIPINCFISYSRTDSDFVVKLRRDLQKVDITTWRDVDDISAGASWDNDIEKAIQGCSHVLLVVSRAAMESANVADEVGYARDRKKPIIPILLDDAPLPLRVHRAQAIDFCHDYETALQKLTSNLNREASSR
jgi:TIR domain.